MANNNMNMNIPENLLNKLGDGAKLIMEKLEGFGLNIKDSSAELGSHLMDQNGILSGAAKEQLGKFAGQAQEFITSMLGGKLNGIMGGDSKAHGHAEGNK